MNIKKIEIPNSVTKIEVGAFSNNELTHVEIPDSVTEIGEGAFYKNKLTHVEIPNSVTEIGADAFSNNELTHVEIPNSVTEIGEGAFAYNQLTHVEIPDSVNKIKEWTFTTNKLTHVEIPDSVEEIGDNAFANNQLTQIEIPDSVTKLGEGAFCKNKLTHVEIPNSVTKLGGSAFSYNQLTNVKIPNSVTSIGNRTFANNRLTRIEIPDSVIEIGFGAFADNQLTQIEIPDSVRVIGQSAFYNNQLTYVKIPNSVTFIDEGAFACNQLTHVEIPNSEVYIDFRAFDDNVILKNNDLIEEVINILNKYNRKKITEIEEFYNKNDAFQKMCSTLFKRKLNLGIWGVRGSQHYNELLTKIEKLYSKTRLEYLPTLEVIEKMDMDLIEKFNLKVWREIAGYDIFIHDDNMKQSLIEIISVFGLFEKDKNKQNRVNELKDIIKNIDYRLTKEQFENLAVENTDVQKFFTKCKVKELRLKENATIQEELSFYLKERITPARYKYIKNLTGNEGKKVNKALDELYEVVEKEYFVINHLNTKEENKQLRDIMITSDIIGKINIESIHRIFSNCPKKFNEQAYEFLIKNLPIILEDEKIQSLVPTILTKFERIKENYGITDNLPTLKQCIDYCTENKFNYSFGNKELAQMAKIAGVSTEEAYQYYEQLNKKLQERKTSTLVRHKDTYEYKGIILKGELLRSDSPLHMFVGETNYTNCCQRYNREGHNCMEHASTSKDGGIFVVSYLKDGKWIPLAQSWDWQNEGVYCHDNIEATQELKNNPQLKDAVAFVYQKDAEKIIKKSSDEIDKYIEKRIKQLEKINITKEEKENEIIRLAQLKERQKIKVVTVGEGFSDINISKTFKEVIKDSRLPKNYSGYSDAIEGSQYIISGTEEELILEDSKYEQITIYKDERRITTEYGEEIKESTLKLLCDIESQVYPDKMKTYTNNGTPVITSPHTLAQIYNEKLENLRVLHGEDWYTVYGIDEEKIEVYDMARGIPRLEEEQSDQTTEINNTLKLLLDEAVKEEKPIVADLKEDTSYLIYLMYLKSGLIEQIGEDYEYSYDNEINIQIITREQQLEKLKRIKEIRKNNNPELLMHRVKFVPSKKYIESYNINNKNISK